MALSHSPSIVTNGLVLCLDAANKRSYPGTGTTWTDLSGNGNNGTLTNGPTFSAANGGSVIFDGTNDYAAFAINILSSSFTIQLSFKINSIRSWSDIAVLDDGTNEVWIELGGSTNPDPYTNGYLRYYSSYYGGSIGSVTNSLASASQYIVNSKIHTSVLTVGSNIAKSYFNGIFQGSANVSESKTFTRLVLANDLIRSGRACSCNIYGVVIYNRALSQAEITQNYNATRGRFL